MLATLLRRLARLTTHKPWWVLLTTTLPLLAAAAMSSQVPWDLSFTGLLDQEDPRVHAYYALAEELNFSGRTLLLVEGPEEELDRATEALLALEEFPGVDRVLDRPPQDWFVEHGPYLLPTEDFDLLMRVATGPLDPGAAEQLRDRIEAQTATIEGVRLVLVMLTDDPVDANLGEVRFGLIDQATQSLLEPFEGVTGSYAGVAAVADQDQRNVGRRVRIITPLSLVMVLGLLALVERRPLRLLVVAMPMVLAAGATLGIVGMVTGKVTFMETFYGVMIFGLGVDFALHLMVRLREELVVDGDPAAALERAWAGSGPGVVIGGLTTAGAFAIVGMADDPTALHLGLSGSIGLSLCLLLMLTWLPAAWTLLGERGEPAPPLEVPGVERLATWATRWPRATLLVALLLLAAAAAGFPRFHYETDLRKVFSRDLPSLATADRIDELFGINPGPWVLRASDLEEARSFTEAVEASPLFSRVDSLASLFPPDQDSRQRRLLEAADTLRMRQGQHRSRLFLAGPKTGDLHRALELIDTLLAAAERGPPTIEELPDWLSEQLLAPDGQLVLLAYTASPNLDGTLAAQERQVLHALDPGAAGIGLTLEVIMEGDRPWLRPVWLGIMLYVTLLLAWDLRKPRLVLAALAPVLVGLISTVGLLCWFGPGFNVMALVVAPLIVGLGVDDGVHVVHRILEHPELPAGKAAAKVGQAIVMTTLTTCSSFTLLLLYGGHVGLEGMARVLLIGLPICLLASITLVPAMLQAGRR